MCSVSAAQSDGALDSSVRQDFMSARALGMGNAYIGAADDYNALMLNPAGLARLETWQVNMSTEFALADDLFKFVEDLNSANSGTTEEEQLESTLNFLKGQYGRTQHFRSVPAAGFWVRPNFGVGFIPLDTSTSISVRQSVSPQLNLKSFNDTTAVMGFGKDTGILGNGRLSWGVTGKIVHRVAVSKAFTALDLAADSELVKTSDIAEGVTVDADLGLLYTPSFPNSGIYKVFKLARPTFGAVLRNALDLGFNTDLNLVNAGANEVPEKLHRRLDLGSSWAYPQIWVFKPRGLIDIRDIGHPNWTPRKGLHIGAELDWKMFEWWKGAYRMGLSQGYFTFGFSARLGLANLDLVTWGEEVGTDLNPKESRRYMLKLNVEI